MMGENPQNADVVFPPEIVARFFNTAVVPYRDHIQKNLVYIAIDPAAASSLSEFAIISGYYDDHDRLVLLGADVVGVEGTDENGWKQVIASHIATIQRLNPIMARKMHFVPMVEGNNNGAMANSMSSFIKKHYAGLMLYFKRHTPLGAVQQFFITTGPMKVEATIEVRKMICAGMLRVSEQCCSSGIASFKYALEDTIEAVDSDGCSFLPEAWMYLQRDGLLPTPTKTFADRPLFVLRDQMSRLKAEGPNADRINGKCKGTMKDDLAIVLLILVRQSRLLRSLYPEDTCE